MECIVKETIVNSIKAVLIVGTIYWC